ncbi:hypothetical protein COM63_31605, partial [Bacillus cereus]
MNSFWEIRLNKKPVLKDSIAVSKIFASLGAPNVPITIMHDEYDLKYSILVDCSSDPIFTVPNHEIFEKIKEHFDRELI